MSTKNYELEYGRLNTNKTLSRLDSSKNGLTEREAEKRLEKYGFNEKQTQ